MSSTEDIRVVADETGAMMSDERRAAVYASIDPKPNGAAAKRAKIGAVAVWLIGLALVFALPFVEDAIRKSGGSMYSPAGPWGYDRMYGLVLIFNLVLPSLLTQLYLAFAVVGGGRKKYGYGLPVMYASVDMHVEDVLSGGGILSGGSADKAQRKLDAAVGYSCHQRAHHNALETLPMFLVLSAAGGVRYPLATAVHGLGWLVSRVTWTRGYLSGHPLQRYGNPFSNYIWVAFLGVIANTIGLAIGVLGGPQ